TLLGGSSSNGTVFQMNTDGTGYTVLKHFSATTVAPSGTSTNSDGANPHAGLTLSGSTLYGTTSGGGSSGYGTVFQVNTAGTAYKVLKHFTVSDGKFLEAGLTLSGSTLYGTTVIGGSSGVGTLFQV